MSRQGDETPPDAADESFCVSEGRVSDAKFLAAAILQAERAHTGRGIWDEYYCQDSKEQPWGDQDSSDSGENATVSTSNALACLQHCVENAVDSIYHYSRFTVIRSSSADSPVACASGFKYPDVTMGRVLKGLRVANAALLQWSEEQSEQAEARLSFLSQAFPAEDVDFTGRWMIEGVYTDPAERGKGLAARVLRAVLQRGGGEAREALITCAEGNTPAFRLYCKLGFRDLGCGDSKECLQKICTKGFHVLRYVYESEE